MENKVSTEKEAQVTSSQTSSNEVIPTNNDSPQTSESRNHVESLLKQQGKEHIFDLIKSFKGKIYTQQDKEYFENIKQYASASIKPSLIQPFFLTYPQGTQDIAIMLKAAHLLSKKVVARSGGHQYCGLSLGGSNTIVLSMNCFNTLKLNQDGIIEVEPCVPLIQFCKQLKSWGMFLPHGRCPLVNVGGHAQTGGYGPFLRSFGIFLDFVVGFEIVLANGELKRVNKPQTNAVISNKEERFNLQLFRGVLGGNAGSFGIVTKYYIKAVKDVDHPQSYGFSHARIYNKDLMLQVLKVLKKWTEIIAEGDSDQSLKGCNVQIATSDIELQPSKQKAHAIFVSGVYGDTDKGVPYNNQFKQILDVFKKGETEQQKELNVFLESWQGHHPLSELAARNVFSEETQLGTNISLPYQNRCNLTMSALNDNFINEFNQFTSKVIHSVESSTHIDIFMMIAGGAHKENGKPTVDGLTITSIPQRDFVHLFMLDISFDLAQDPLAGEKTKQIQSQMDKIVVEHYNTPGLGPKKVFAGSFGDLDMTKPEVINAYYDSVEQYEQLQKLKEKVDPHDIFHTVMTVKLPNK